MKSGATSSLVAPDSFITMNASSSMLMLASKPLSSICKFRRRQAGSISEFGPALFMVLLIFLPACNFALFSSAYIGLNSLTKETIEEVAMSESVEQAHKHCKELLHRFDNPALTFFHHVQLSSDASKSPKLSLVVQPAFGGTELTFDLPCVLPRDKQPEYRNNMSNMFYFYRLKLNCTVSPILNLSGLPIVGEMPLVGAPANLNFTAQAPIENLNSLNSSPTAISQ